MSDRRLQVAIFDENRVLVEVRVVDPGDHVTDPKRRQMKLPIDNDVQKSDMIGKYRATPHYKTIEPILSEFPKQEFFETLGVTVARWQSIENMLLALFIKLIHPGNAAAASDAFRSVVQFRTRLGMVNAAAKAILRNEFSEWKGLHKKIQELSGMRNKLAHGHPKYISGSESANDHILAKTEAELEGLRTSEISEIGALFAELGVDLEAFIRKI